MPKKEEPEYRIFNRKSLSLGNGNEVIFYIRGKHLFMTIHEEGTNNKTLTRVTNGIIPDPKGEKTLTIKHNQIIPKTITPLIGIPKIQRLKPEIYWDIIIEISKKPTGTYKIEMENTNGKAICQTLTKYYKNPTVKIFTRNADCYITKKD